MNKKKLPKVIVCRDEEPRPAASLTGATPAGERGREYGSMGNAGVSELPAQAGDNVVHMLRPAGPGSPDREPKITPSPQVSIDAPRRSRAHAIVNRYAAYSAIGALSPITLANFTATTAIILRMVKVLCKHYGVPFKHDRARTLVIALVGGAMPAGAAAITASTLLYIAPPTAIFGVAVSSMTAAVFTRSVGRIFIEHFEAGASLDGVSA